MATLILEDRNGGNGADDCSFYDFDPRNGEVLEQIETVLACRSTKSEALREYLSGLCETSLDANGIEGRKPSLAERLKKAVDSFRNRYGKYIGRTRRHQNRPTRHIPHLSAA